MALRAERFGACARFLARSAIKIFSVELCVHSVKLCV